MNLSYLAYPTQFLDSLKEASLSIISTPPFFATAITVLKEPKSNPTPPAYILYKFLNIFVYTII